jgi:hypothetical protein
VKYEDAPIHRLAEEAGKTLDRECRLPAMWKTKARREVAIHWLWGDFRYPARLSRWYRWTVFRRKVLYTLGIVRDLWRVL